MARRLQKRPTDDETREAIRTYERTHWGLRGNGRVSRMYAPNPLKGVAVELGKLVKVIYYTEKGGEGGPVYYDHDFEDGLPVLAFNSPRSLLICGGDYRVTTHGIEG